MRVLVAGAGIGGLTLAAALARVRVSVALVERAPALEPVGAGITVQPNATLVLRALGIDEAVVAEGAILHTGAIRHWRGRVLQRLDVATVARELGAPMVGIHRGRLQAVLRAAAPDVPLATGRSVRGYREDATGVTVLLEDGTTATGEVLVGADGLRSAVRRQLLADGEPRYAGYTSWRGVCEAASLVEPGGSSESWGPGARFGIVPIGRGEVYWYACANAAPGGCDDDPRAALLARFRDWHAPVAALVEATPVAQVLRTDIVDRPAARTWSAGRVVLLGDAAHPMTPNLGQGGCQAIEDAVVLAAALAHEPDHAAAFAAYTAARRSRADGMVTQARVLGRVAQWENVVLRVLRDGLAWVTPSAVAMRNVRAVATPPPSVTRAAASR